MAKPKWATPSRQAHLVKLFLHSEGFCIRGERPCPRPWEHHYQPFTEALIADWKADDRAEREALRKALERAMHGLAEKGPMRGQFNATGRDAFHAQQPQYYLVGLGVSGLTFKPFAQVRIGSSYLNLQVDLGDALRGLSKARKRKALRYGKALPKEVQEVVDFLCGRAVRDYLRQARS